MSSKNDENAGLAIALAVLGMIAMFVFAVLAFLAAILTVLSLLAWNKPLKLTDEITILPSEARLFVGCGIAGAIILPVFAVFFCALYSVHMTDQLLGYLVIGGYVFGSLGVACRLAEEEKKAEEMRQAAALREQLAAKAQPQNVLPFRKPEAEPFRFADWNDGPEDAQ